MGPCERQCLLRNLAGFVLALLLTVVVAAIITIATAGVGAVTIPAIMAIVAKVIGPLAGGTALLLIACLQSCGVAEGPDGAPPGDDGSDARTRGDGFVMQLTILTLTSWFGGLLVHWLV